MPFSALVWLGGFQPTKIDYRKKSGTLLLTSLLENLEGFATPAERLGGAQIGSRVQGSKWAGDTAWAFFFVYFIWGRSFSGDTQKTSWSQKTNWGGRTWLCYCPCLSNLEPWWLDSIASSYKTPWRPHRRNATWWLPGLGRLSWKANALDVNPGWSRTPGWLSPFSGDSDHFWRDHPPKTGLLRSWVDIIRLTQPTGFFGGHQPRSELLVVPIPSWAWLQTKQLRLRRPESLCWDTMFEPHPMWSIIRQGWTDSPVDFQVLWCTVRSEGRRGGRPALSGGAGWAFWRFWCGPKKKGTSYGGS